MIVIPEPLSPIYINSFAYITFKDRLPVILARIVDSLYRNKKIITDELGSDKIESLKYITAELSRLRHELTTDKPLVLFESGVFGDEDLWNNAILEEKSRLIQSDCNIVDISWFKTSFLFGECYMYRRIFDSVLRSGFNELDQFYFEKMELLEKAMEIQSFLTKFLNEIWSQLISLPKTQLFFYFDILVKMSLWGNEADLSLSIDDERAKIKLETPERIIEENNNKLLIDDIRQIFEHLYDKSKTNHEVIVTIFLDNSGSELLADLHLVEFLLQSKLCNKVVLVAKSMPWYVSDVTEKDFQNTITKLCESSNHLNQWLGMRILSRVSEDFSLSVRSHLFLTLPHPFHKMLTVFPDFYKELSQSTLLIFKGDLNYRKLVGDLKWPVVDTSFDDSLLEFNPAPIVALRVLKCDVQVGLTADTFTRVTTEYPDDWWISSRYGVIQSSFTVR